MAFTKTLPLRVVLQTCRQPFPWVGIKVQQGTYGPQGLPIFGFPKKLRQTTSFHLCQWWPIWILGFVTLQIRCPSLAAWHRCQCLLLWKPESWVSAEKNSFQICIPKCAPGKPEWFPIFLGLRNESNTLTMRGNPKPANANEFLFELRLSWSRRWGTGWRQPWPHSHQDVLPAPVCSVSQVFWG